MAGSLLLALLALPGCASLPSLEGREESAALRDVAGTPIHDALAAPLAAHPGLSGIYVLRDGEDAFAARIALIDAAARSLDIQYYIWHDDLTGRLMFDAVRRAADRGVRVRLLLDDNNTVGLDPTLAAFDAHANIEVRLFNPFMQRSLRLLAFLTDFARLNRRMHNKSMTADGAATIVGGRNVGDEYFAFGTNIGFVDLDVVAVGPAVVAVVKSFDDYWRCDSAYPVARLLPPATAADVAVLAQRGEAVRGEPRAARYLAKVADTRVMRDLVAQELPFEWAVARLVVDEPSKGLGKAQPGGLLLSNLDAAFGGPAKYELAIVSPYFVPGRRGTRMLRRFAESGVKLKILTNALESTDVAAVHSGYAKRRRDLLKSGAELYELRRDASAAAAAAVVPGPKLASGRRARPKRSADTVAGAGGSGSGGSGSRSGSSASSLHAKTIAVDAERIYIGSFNVDPRSAVHNTELGLVIDSASMAGALSLLFLKEIPQAAYQVRLDGHRKLEWIELRPDGSVIRHHDEPGASLGRRIAVTLLGLL